MAGYSQKENVRKVIVVGKATQDSKGVAAVYKGVSVPNSDDIPADGDWSGEKRKQLRVRPNVSWKDVRDDGRYHFNVDIPKNFFDSAGKFTASPKYSKGEGLHVKFTGNGSEAGYIDMNVQGRGAGGNSVVTEEGCAKWS
jgi:hypothetical protein